MHPAFELQPQYACSIEHLAAVTGEFELTLVRVPHLLGGRHTGGRDRDYESDVLGERCRERRNPAALAEAPKADAVRSERSGHRERISGLSLEAAARRLALGLAVAAPVECRDADAAWRQSLVQVTVERRGVARPVARPVEGDERCLSGCGIADGETLDAQVLHDGQ